MKKLKKITFVQSAPYKEDETRLAQYHGAVFAEYLRGKGVDATKMVLGDSLKKKPSSPLLSISSYEERCSPEWWAKEDYDIVLVYGGMDFSYDPVFKAIKKGAPRTVVFLRMDAAYGPFFPKVRRLCQNFHITYVNDRYSHIFDPAVGHQSNSVFGALAIAAVNSLRVFSPRHTRAIVEHFQLPDYVTYENQSALDDAKKWIQEYGGKRVEEKFIWCGFPIRASFSRILSEVERKPASILSVANWKPQKDIALHAKTTKIVLERCPEATFTIVGENSRRVFDRISRIAPEHIARVNVVEEIENKDLPSLYQSHQIHMLCSKVEGICSTPIEALSSGCSAALPPGVGVPCFREFVANDCGTLAVSRSPEDMANAVLKELELWESGVRTAEHMRNEWARTRVDRLCDILLEKAQLELPQESE
ncbi:MAG: glycosyltransferase [Kiritimatiellales bacterium]